MEQIFLKVLNISISASILILVVMAARMLLKKAPKWCVMLLWAIVALRLVIPIPIETAFSLIPRGMDEKIESIEAAVMDRKTEQQQIPQAEAESMSMTVTEGIQETATFIPYDEQKIAEPVKRELSIFEIAGYIWVTGVGLMLMFSMLSYIKLKHRIAESVKYKDNIYLSDRTATAFILGLIRPRIYLPSGIDEGEIAYVMAHEYSHIKRGDHLWKPLAYLLLCVYWFNPLMWLAYSLLSRDIEYACDEKTVSGYDMKDRKAYAAALLENSMQKKLVMVCPLAFGEGNIKERVRNVLDHKRPAFWICIVSLVVVAIVAICFATKPKNDGNTLEQGETVVTTEENKVEIKEWYWPSVSPIDGILRFGTKKNGSILDHVEISGREGAPVFAACEGSIAEKGYDDEWGNYIVEDIGNGILLKYGQLGSDYTYTGDIVKHGQIIGLVKKAKGCTIARLYYAAYENGVAIDPLSLTDNWTFDQSEEIMKRFIDTVDADPVTTDVSVYKYMSYGQDGGHIATHMYIDREEDGTEEHLSEVSERLNEELQKVLEGEFENEIDKDRYKVSFSPLNHYDRMLRYDQVQRELLSVDRLSAKALPEYKNDDYFICSCEVSATQISYVVEFDEPVEGDRIVEIYFRKADGSLITLQQLAGNVTEIKFLHEGDPDFKRYRYTQVFSSMINLSSIVAVVMNGVEYSFDDGDHHNEVDIPETLRPFLSAFIEKNSTFYVNAYDVCEKLGATIKNDDGNYAIRYLNNTIEFSLGEYKLYLNGEERDMGGAVAMLDGDELLLPCRYIDSLGARISMYYPEKGRVHPPEEWLITP